MNKLTSVILKISAALGLWLTLFGASAVAQTLTVAGWNIESGKSRNSAVAERIKDYQGIDLWGMSEVMNDAALQAVEEAAEDGENANFERILSTTGGNDRLGIVYNAKRFALVRKDELSSLTGGSNNQRAPLFAEMREISSGKKIIFMVNHLARQNFTLRHEQATGLNDWVKNQTLPVVAVGDYNFDWRVNNGDDSHDKGYDNMVRDGSWKWVRPATLVKTHCGGSVLDFVWVNRAAQNWNGKAETLTKNGDCPAKYTDDLINPDHRIIRAVFNLDGTGGTDRDDLLDQIRNLQKQIDDLKKKVEKIDNN
jgi:hypothetical protein